MFLTLSAPVRIIRSLWERKNPLAREPLRQRFGNVGRDQTVKLIQFFFLAAFSPVAGVLIRSVVVPYR